ncbi:hypothetical protein BO78DRAFT_394292 [Aspergillus sclerotiicarbonarius CBS 121057]|uniref:Uncharacterized protein n=1 Tax=Aspergillus sclerotiicarbonarius (strain CBS 121057 / IBT 28362) TaxID=1448318 RepID=A0A319FM28_ASPSB|nr:hypothetical protein BO78DRAFT_394292 [Aspergillus sclerotiicarbonarius CBS 121057]
MMFAALPTQQQPQSQSQPQPSQQLQHTPTRPSPLSPHRTPTTTTTTSQFNLNFNFSSPFATPIKTPSTSVPTSPSPIPQQQQQQPSSSNYAHRYATNIPNPMNKHMMTSASPSARRNLFLNRVKRARDEGRFENRGEQLVLMELVAEEKRWGEGMRRRAERFGGVEEEEDGEMEEGISDDMDAHALDEYLQEQAAEMERVEYLNDMYQGGHRQQSDGSGGGGAGASFSDEEEYDDLFMDLAEHQPHLPGPSQGFAHSQDMDMS